MRRYLFLAVVATGLGAAAWSLLSKPHSPTVNPVPERARSTDPTIGINESTIVRITRLNPDAWIAFTQVDTGYSGYHVKDDRPVDRLEPLEIITRSGTVESTRLYQVEVGGGYIKIPADIMVFPRGVKR